MPWEHCDSTVLDDEPCPACGVSKEQWTLEWNATREFALTRRPLLKISLTDPAEEPIGAEPYRVELPDGETVEGQLDEFGYAKVVAPEHGTCTVAFPERGPGEIVAFRDPERADGDEAATDDDATADPPTFSRETGVRKHRFVLDGPRLVLRLPARVFGEEGALVVVRGEEETVLPARDAEARSRGRLGFRVPLSEGQPIRLLLRRPDVDDHTLCEEADLSDSLTSARERSDKRAGGALRLLLPPAPRVERYGGARVSGAVEDAYEGFAADGED